LTLSEGARKHIRERHPEVARYEDSIKEVLEDPEMVFKGNTGRMKAVRYLDETHLGPKYLVVAYREEDCDKAIITAYFTSNLKKIKGEVVWKA